MPTTSTLRERLRSETRPWHDAVEGAMSFGPSLDAASYCRILRLFYGFYRPLEQANPLFDPAVSFDGLDRRKTQRIVQDLADFGDTAPLVVCDNLPPLATTAQQLGCLYVVEGSTLGGQVILRQAVQSLDVSDDFGGRFFNCYGAQTGARWQSFIKQLEAFDGPADEVVASACDTFARFNDWIAASAEQLVETD